MTDKLPAPIPMPSHLFESVNNLKIDDTEAHIDQNLSRIPQLPDEEVDAHMKAANEALSNLVNQSSQEHFSPSAAVLQKTDKIERHPWLHKLVPNLERLANYEHLGNYVIINRTDDPAAVKRQWESMPIYVRLSMHLLFCSAHTYLSNSYIESELKKQSIAQGKLFDSEAGAQEHIKSFITTYDLEGTLQELEEPDPTKYKTFNDFFTRKLKAGARPVDSQDDERIITSAADCRLTVFNDIDSAKEFWVKDKKFNLPSLIENEKICDLPEFVDGGAIAIFRLAPADFHRFVSPVKAKLENVDHLPGQYYTVNPQAVNEDFPVFTANRRDVSLLSMPTSSGKSVPVVFVAVGAMLVGSIIWTIKEEATVEKGAELGYFAYGGSTCIAVFPKGSVEFDEDLVRNSKNRTETQVKCGQHIARFINL